MDDDEDSDCEDGSGWCTELLALDDSTGRSSGTLTSSSDAEKKVGMAEKEGKTRSEAAGRVGHTHTHTHC